MTRALTVPRAVALVAVLAGLLVALNPPAALGPQGGIAAGLVLATIGLLATAAIPEYATGLFFFLVAILLGIAPTEVVFAGFQSAALWLVFGGMVIGLGVRRTGLAERLARSIAGAFGTRYFAIIAGMVAIGVALGFLMPSTLGRIMVLLPITLAMADAFGFAPDSNGRKAMVLAMSFGTMQPCFTILPATVPGVILAGASETLYGIPTVYGTYLLLHFPVMGLLKAVAIVLFVHWMFPDRPTGSGRTERSGAMGREERLMTMLLVLALALWVTDFLHGVSPGWVALGVAAVLALPFVGLVPPRDFNDQVNYTALIYVAAVMGLGAIITHTGIGEAAAKAVLEVVHLAPGDDARTFFTVAVFSALIAMATTQPGLPATLTPLAGQLAEATGLSIETMLMMQAIGFTLVALPYQTPPIVLAMQLGGVPMRDGSRLCLAVLAVALLILLPLDYLWWRALGWIG